MGKDIITATVIGNSIELERKQWKGHKAKISQYPGLLEAVNKHTWTYSVGEHPYLRSSKLGMSLHKFVLSFIYGEAEVDNMLANGHIIEHLDNDGLNCSYDNLHIISADYNKAKAFTIDKEAQAYNGIPHFVTDVYYSHQRNYYQMQVFLNDDIVYFCQSEKTPVPVEELFFQYTEFRNLYIDWLYILGCREVGTFNIRKFNNDRLFFTVRPLIEVTEEEKDHAIIERDGRYYLNIRTSGEKLAVLSKTAYVNLEEATEDLKD